MRKQNYQAARNTCSALTMFSTLVALTISIVAFSGHTMAQCITSNCGSQSSGRVYNVAHGHGSTSAYSFFDDQGYMRGLIHQLIPEVCDAAGIQCNMVWVPWQWCWNSLPGLHSFGGRALMDGWVDACTQWDKTTDRLHVFDFSMPYKQEALVGFAVKAGTTFDTTDLTGKKIGFVAGWYADEKCLARQQSPSRQNYILSVDQIVYEADTPPLIAGILNDEIDAAFGAIKWYINGIDDGSLEFVQSNTPMKCTLWGSSMMTRKDNDFNDHWNRGFQKLVANGRFLQICQEATVTSELRGGGATDCTGA